MAFGKEQAWLSETCCIGIFFFYILWMVGLAVFISDNFFRAC